MRTGSLIAIAIILIVLGGSRFGGKRPEDMKNLEEVDYV